MASCAADKDVAELAASFSGASLGPSQRPSNLKSYLALAGLELDRVCGDGNCLYYATARSLGKQRLDELGWDSLEHAPGHTASAADLRLQLALRAACVDWLQLESSEEHRRVGTSSEPPVWDQAKGMYKPIPPPPPSAVEHHRRSGGQLAYPPPRRRTGRLAVTSTSGLHTLLDTAAFIGVDRR